MRHALDAKEKREESWCRKFSSAVYAKEIIDEVVPPVANLAPVLTAGNLDGSLGSWSSLELDEPAIAPQPALSVGRSVVQSKALLRGKIQAGIQGRVNDFWKEKVGYYMMQGDYIELLMEDYRFERSLTSHSNHVLRFLSRFIPSSVDVI